MWLVMGRVDWKIPKASIGKIQSAGKIYGSASQGRPRAKLFAAMALGFVFDFGVCHGLPLEVSHGIRAAIAQGDDMVLNPAGTPPGGHPGRRAGASLLECVQDSLGAVLARFGGEGE